MNTTTDTTTTAPAAPARRRKTYEVMEYAAMMRRMIRAHGRRVAGADVEDLTELIALRDELDRAIQTAVDGQRNDLGRSWAEIARATGVTRQAAHARWGAQA